MRPLKAMTTGRAALALAWLAALPAIAIAAQEAPEIRAEVRPQKATVGEILEYRVLVRGKNAGAWEILPPEKRELYPEKKEAPRTAKEGGEDEDPAALVPIYVIHSSKKDDRSTGGVTDIAVNVKISYYHPGSHELPMVRIKGPDGIDAAYRLPRVEINEVNKKGELQPPEPPLELSGNYWRLLFVALGLITAGIAGFLAWRYLVPLLRRLRAAPPVPPIDAFMKDIEGFAGHELIAQDRIEEYVFGISMIFRRFLSRRYGIDAEEMTSNEVDEALRRAAPESRARHREALDRCFMLWDISKFAEFAPDRAALTANLEMTIGLAHEMAAEGPDGQA